jgi:hypothetical protein
MDIFWEELSKVKEIADAAKKIFDEGINESDSAPRRLWLTLWNQIYTGQ